MSGTLASLAFLLHLAGAGGSFAESNVNPQRCDSWAGSFGWCNWCPSSENGVQVGQFVCAGYIYAPNLGWISLGNGSPSNGIQYGNQSGSDFGVNVDSNGNLRGLAYSANAGWISFEGTGAPKIDLTTGQLDGFAYGANVGWIGLGNGSAPLRVDSINSGTDSDHDGLPDAWEYSYAPGDLGKFGKETDSDHDGQSDLQEYLAGTDPLDPNDSLRIIGFSFAPDQTSLAITWTSKLTRQYRVETSSSLGSTNDWIESDLGLVVPDGNLTARVLPPAGSHQMIRIRAFRPLIP